MSTHEYNIFADEFANKLAVMLSDLLMSTLMQIRSKELSMLNGHFDMINKEFKAIDERLHDLSRNISEHNKRITNIEKEIKTFMLQPVVRKEKIQPFESKKGMFLSTKEVKEFIGVGTTQFYELKKLPGFPRARHPLGNETGRPLYIKNEIEEWVNSL